MYEKFSGLRWFRPTNRSGKNLLGFVTTFSSEADVTSGIVTDHWNVKLEHLEFLAGPLNILGNRPSIYELAGRTSPMQYIDKTSKRQN